MSWLLDDLHRFALPMRPASRYRRFAFVAIVLGFIGTLFAGWHLNPFAGWQIHPAASRIMFLLSLMIAVGALSLIMSVPMTWLVGSVVLTGFVVLVLQADVVLANAGSDRQLHETRYVLVRRFPLWPLPLIPVVGAAIYHWLPRLSGYRYNEHLGALHAWTTVIGLITYFQPLIAFGFIGIFIGPRRYLDYPEAFSEWQRIVQQIAWSGLALIAFGGLIFIYVIFDMFTRKCRT